MQIAIKNRKRLCLITNREVSDLEKNKIQDLYFDHDFCINEYSEAVDYFFFDVNSFNDNELKDIFTKLKSIKNDFNLNIYSLLSKEDRGVIDKAVSRVSNIFHGLAFKWNTFCRNLVFNMKFKNLKKKVLIELCSSSLGDSLAWVPYAEEYRKQKDYDVCLFTFKKCTF